MRTVGAGLTLLWLAACGGGSPAIPETSGVARTPPDARAIFDACLAAHGGRAAYARLHDVNVHFDSHWAAVGPRLQPVLSDRRYRQGSEERYLPVRGGFVVGQLHRGSAGGKSVYRESGKVMVSYGKYMEGIKPGYDFAPSQDPEVKQAASLVTDAYAMFLWGPYFFVQRGATFQKLPATLDLGSQTCDELLTVLRPGLGTSPEDKVILFIGQRDHLLHRVQFTLNALESTRGAEVHVGFPEHKKFAGVMWPTHYSERIDRPVNLPAHQWRLLGIDVNRGYAAGDLATPGFGGRAAAPAKGTPADWDNPADRIVITCFISGPPAVRGELSTGR